MARRRRSAPAPWSRPCPPAAAAAAPPDRTGFATGMTNATKTVGGAIASAIFAIALASTGSLDDPTEGHAPLGGYLTVWAVCAVAALLAAGALLLMPRRGAPSSRAAASGVEPIHAACTPSPRRHRARLSWGPEGVSADARRRDETRRARRPDGDAEFAIDGDPAPRTRPTGPRARGRRERIRQQHTWVDLQIRQAMERGDFDDLPGAGKPIEGLGAEHDPDWWLKKLVEREQIARAARRPSQLRKEDAELDDRLDTLTRRGRGAPRGRGLQRPRDPRPATGSPEGPPLITMPRDVEDEVARLARAAYGAGRGPAGRRAAARPRRSRRPRRRRWWPRAGGAAAGR